MAALALAAEHYDLGLEAFLQQVESIVHGTTVSTNALIVAKVGRAGFIVNEGHPHVLLLREGPRKRSFDWSTDFPRTLRADAPDARGRRAHGCARARDRSACRRRRFRGGRAFPQGRRRGDRRLAALVDGQRRTRASRSRDRPCRVARGLSHARPRAQPDPARVSARDLDGDQRIAPSGRERIRGRAEQRPAAGGVCPRTFDRQLYRRDDAAGGDHRQTDLLGHVRADAGAHCRPAFDQRGRLHRRRYGRHHIRCLSGARRPARRYAGSHHRRRHARNPQGRRTLDRRRRR